MKICIVKLSAMGDIVHSMVALQFIKHKYPSCTIDWIVEKSFEGILQNNPCIDNVLPIQLKKIKKDKFEIFNQIKILKSYSKNNYDILIDAQGLLKSAIVSKIVGAKQIVGFDKNSIREGVASWFYDKKVSIAYDENTINRNVKVMCEYLDITFSQDDIIHKQPFLFSSAIVENMPKNYNLFVIGSTWESRNYPKEKFVQIAQQLKIDTYIIWGSEDEKQKAIWMEKQSEYLHILPKGNLDTLKQIIKNCNLLIGNDTGPTHIAWALNVPSVTIFGCTPTNRVYITPINKVVKSNSTINHYKLDKNDFSIQDIKVDEIIKQIGEIDD
jgi:heptosyltransferase-1